MSTCSRRNIYSIFESELVVQEFFNETLYGATHTSNKMQLLSKTEAQQEPVVLLRTNSAAGHLAHSFPFSQKSHHKIKIMSFSPSVLCG